MVKIVNVRKEGGGGEMLLGVAATSRKGHFTMLKPVQVAGMALNHMSKYINPTIDLNYAIHDLKYLSSLH